MREVIRDYLGELWEQLPRVFREGKATSRAACGFLSVGGIAFLSAALFLNDGAILTLQEGLFVVAVYLASVCLGGVITLTTLCVGARRLLSFRSEAELRKYLEEREDVCSTEQ